MGRKKFAIGDLCLNDMFWRAGTVIHIAKEKEFKYHDKERIVYYVRYINKEGSWTYPFTYSGGDVVCHRFVAEELTKTTVEAEQLRDAMEELNGT